MKVIVLPLAEADLDDIYIIYEEKSQTTASKIFNSILDEIGILESFPQAAPIEPLLKGQSKIFRSLVISNGLFKAIYFVEADTVYITHIWCCRPNPRHLQRRY